MPSQVFLQLNHVGRLGCRKLRTQPLNHRDHLALSNLAAALNCSEYGIYMHQYCPFSSPPTLFLVAPWVTHVPIHLCVDRTRQYLNHAHPAPYRQAHSSSHHTKQANVFTKMSIIPTSQMRLDTSFLLLRVPVQAKPVEGR